jgi:hypothetical protein
VPNETNYNGLARYERTLSGCNPLGWLNTKRCKNGREWTRTIDLTDVNRADSKTRKMAFLMSFYQRWNYLRFSAFQRNRGV